MLKGNALIGQSGGPTAVINQSLVGAIQAARPNQAIQKFWGMCHGIEGLLRDETIDLRQKSSAFLRETAGQPSAALGSSRHPLKEGEEKDLVQRLRRRNVRYLFMIGGNDTAQTLLRIAQAAGKENYELRVLHIPKTVDNDLMETDHSPGYGSAARFAAVTTQEAGLDSRAMQRIDRVKVIELAGRNSGWIVAASALLKKKESDPPHLLFLPEVPFSEEFFLNRVEGVLEKIGYCLAVISETIRDPNGVRVGVRRDGVTHDPFGHPYVEGAAAHLVRLVESRLKVRARFDKPGTIARSSIPYASAVDQKEAYEAGGTAVRWALQGKSNVMVGFKRRPGKNYRIDTLPVPLERVAGKERDLPSSFLNSAKTGINASFRAYALPLI